MKILFWLLAILSLPVGWFMTLTSWFSHGMDLSGTAVGEVVGIAGSFSLVVCIVGIVLGIIKLCKGNAKKAVLFVLIGWIYSGLMFGGLLLDDALYTRQVEREMEHIAEELYGENWDAAPAIEGIPEEYQKLLNKFYVLVRDEATDDRLMGLGAVSMSGYYGDNALDNIGFSLMDVNGDGLDELVIGTTAPVEEGGTAVFCVYTDAENPNYAINSVEGQIYYLHSDEADGAYVAEIAGANAAWVITPVQAGDVFDFNYREGTMDPTGRLTLELIPFSAYKG